MALRANRKWSTTIPGEPANSVSRCYGSRGVKPIAVVTSLVLSFFKTRLIGWTDARTSNRGADAQYGGLGPHCRSVRAQARSLARGVCDSCGWHAGCFTHPEWLACVELDWRGHPRAGGVPIRVDVWDAD